MMERDGHRKLGRDEQRKDWLNMNRHSIRVFANDDVDKSFKCGRKCRIYHR